MTSPYITIFMAMSLNGLIAREDGREDFLSHDNWLTFCNLVSQKRNFIAGRKSYEIVNQWPEYNFNTVDADLKIVVSQKKTLNLTAPYRLVGSPREAIKVLSDAGFGEGLLVGGSELNTAFLREGLVDEIRINVEPVMIANGLPFLSACNLDVPLQLEEVIKNDRGIVTLRYRCLNRSRQ